MTGTDPVQPIDDGVPLSVPLTTRVHGRLVIEQQAVEEDRPIYFSIDWDAEDVVFETTVVIK
jgi:hypothetical protein